MISEASRCERAQRREPDERSEPAKRRASEAVGESEGQRPSDDFGAEDRIRTYTLLRAPAPQAVSEPELCSANSSVMGNPQSAVCGTVTAGAATSPTVSDGLPVTKAIYGNAPRKTCGW